MPDADGLSGRVQHAPSLTAWVEGTGGNAHALARQTLAGMAAVDWGVGPRTGFEAAEFFLGLHHDRPPASLAAEHSLVALRLAANLDVDTPVDLARWLYAFGAAPLSVDDARAGRWGDRLLRSDETIRLASRYDVSVGQTWEFWQRRELGDDDTPLYKIYVAPRSDAQDEAFSIVLDLLLQTGPPAFKVVKDRVRSARRDKFVIYQHDVSARDALAAELTAHFEGLSGCPVPFTLQFNDEGTICCAEDPQPHRPAPRQSWRSWCTAHLGQSLSMARRSAMRPVALGPVDFALFRIALDGIDTGRWCRADLLSGAN